MKNRNSKTQTPGTASDVLRILSENRKKKSFVGIDYFRVVFALFVVFIHAFDHSTGLDSFFYYVFASIAVPWFLIVSGYFAYKSFCYIVNDRI